MLSRSQMPGFGDVLGGELASVPLEGKSCSVWWDRPHLGARMTKAFGGGDWPVESTCN